MFFNSSFFWFVMGSVFVLVAAGFKVFAEDRGWHLSWWKGLLATLWYAIFVLSFFAWGTLIGENEGDAGFKLLLLGLFISVVLGVGLWRLISRQPVAVTGKEDS